VGVGEWTVSGLVICELKDFVECFRVVDSVCLIYCYWRSNDLLATVPIDIQCKGGVQSDTLDSSRRDSHNVCRHIRICVRLPRRSLVTFKRCHPSTCRSWYCNGIGQRTICSLIISEVGNFILSLWVANFVFLDDNSWWCQSLLGTILGDCESVRSLSSDCLRACCLDNDDVHAGVGVRISLPLHLAARFDREPSLGCVINVGVGEWTVSGLVICELKDFVWSLSIVYFVDLIYRNWWCQDLCWAVWGDYQFKGCILGNSIGASCSHCDCVNSYIDVCIGLPLCS